MPPIIATAPHVAAATALGWGAFRTGMGIGHYVDQAFGGAPSTAIAHAITRVAGPAPQGLINVADRLGLQRNIHLRPSWMK